MHVYLVSLQHSMTKLTCYRTLLSKEDAGNSLGPSTQVQLELYTVTHTRQENHSQ